MTRPFLLAWLGFSLLALLFYSGHRHLTDEDITFAAARALQPQSSLNYDDDIGLVANPSLAARYHYGLLTLWGTAVTMFVSPWLAMLALLGVMATVYVLPWLLIVLPLGLLLYRRWFSAEAAARIARRLPRQLTALLASLAVAWTLALLFASFHLMPLHLLLFGVTAACCHQLALRAGCTPRRALAAALLACASSSLLVWSEFIKDEIYGVAALAGALTAFAAARPHVAALCLVLALFAKPALIVATLPLAFAGGKRCQTLLCLFAVLAAAGAIGTHNLVRFGAMAGGYQQLLPTGQPQNFSFPVWLGLAGHLFSPLRSIFLYNPFLLLVLPVAIARCRRRAATRLEWCAAIGALAYLLLISAWTGWEGEVGYANRLALPAVMLGIVFLPAAVRTASRTLLLLLLLAGFLINLPGSAWDFVNYYQLPERQQALVFAVRQAPLSPPAFQQAGEMLALGYQALFTAVPRLLSESPAMTSAPSVSTPLEYHFWLGYPDLWPVYLFWVPDGFPLAQPAAGLGRRWPGLLLPWCLWCALCLTCLWFCHRLRRLPPPRAC